jgi:uncharacterized protein
MRKEKKIKLTKNKIINEIKKREKEIKEKFNVKSLSLFGSYARGKQKSESDIDILVEFEGKYDFVIRIDLQTYLYLLFDKDIGLCEKNTIRKEYKPFIINKELIKIC